MDTAQTVPMPAPTRSLADLHRAAQERIRLHPQGLAFHGLYTPLTRAMHEAEYTVDPAMMQKLADHCKAILDADDDQLARMIRDGRIAPGVKTGQELDDARMNAAALSAANTFLANRPRISLHEQVSAMESRGFRFNAHGKELRVCAPPGVMTEGDRGVIRQNKDAILAHLQTNAEVF